jgi:hypothetical protein
MAARSALIVVDVQRGFDDAGFWGPRNNTACEENVRALIAAWRGSNQPIVFVRHHWDEDGSPLRSDEAGSQFKDVVEGEPDLLVTKRVNSAFHGDPDLERWLTDKGIEGIVVCGIQTNMCCETTARVGANLGFEMSFARRNAHLRPRRPRGGHDRRRRARSGHGGEPRSGIRPGPDRCRGDRRPTLGQSGRAGDPVAAKPPGSE